MSLQDKKTEFVTVELTDAGKSASPGASTKSNSGTKLTVAIFSGITILVLVVAAILIGIYIFTDAQKNLIKDVINIDEHTKQEMTMNPSNAIVEYHVTNQDYDALIVDDYNTCIQVMKLKTASGTNCYVNSLNATGKPDWNNVNKPSMMNTSSVDEVSYITGSSPIPFISFLSKTARDTCRGVSTYWMCPKCDGKGGRVKRSCPQQLCYTPLVCDKPFGRCTKQCINIPYLVVPFPKSLFPDPPPDPILNSGLQSQLS